MTALAAPHRFDAVSFKATNQLADGVRGMLAAGLDPISLATARPNFDTPAVIKQAVIEAINVPHTYMTYSESRGLIELREAVAEKLSGRNEVNYDPETELLITAGTHEALFTGLQALVQAGDEVLLIDPSWTAYRGMVRLAGAEPVMVPLVGGRLDAAVFRSAITAKTKAMVISNPGNPTGTVFTREELQVVADAAIDHGFVVLVDEIYEEFVYDDHQHVSLASLPGMQGNTLLINGYSKAYAMTGWRVGYAAGPAWLIDRMLVMHQHLISAPTSFAQKGAVVAYSQAGESVRQMVAEYRARRDALLPLLAEVPGVVASLPQGACFYFLCVESELTSVELTERLAREAALLITPGSAFGPSGEKHLRLSFAALPRERIPEVIARMTKVLANLS